MTCPYRVASLLRSVPFGILEEKVLRRERMQRTCAGRFQPGRQESPQDIGRRGTCLLEHVQTLPFH